MAQTLRIATWNINSLRLRLGLIGKVVEALNPDILCLQETKVPDELFPTDGVAAFGFDHVLFKGMKGYNGVAILSRVPLQRQDIAPDWCEKGDCRHLAALAQVPGGAVEINNFYVPAGGDVPDREANPKFGHKLDFVSEATQWFAARSGLRRTVLVGDLNIAPMEHDVWSHKQLLDIVSHTPVEIDAMGALHASLGFIDLTREAYPEPQKLASWWSYRAQDFRQSNRGLRLDHILVTPGLRDAAFRSGSASSRIHDDVREWERPSDHAPVTADLAL